MNFDDIFVPSSLKAAKNKKRKVMGVADKFGVEYTIPVTSRSREKDVLWQLQEAANLLGV